MTRPLADTTRVEMSYSIAAPRMYKGVIQSTYKQVYWLCRRNTIDTFKNAAGTI